MNDTEQHGLRRLASSEPPVQSPTEAKDVLLALAPAEHKAVCPVAGCDWHRHRDLDPIRWTRLTHTPA